MQRSSAVDAAKFSEPMMTVDAKFSYGVRDEAIRELASKEYDNQRSFSILHYGEGYQFSASARTLEKLRHAIEERFGKAAILEWKAVNLRSSPAPKRSSDEENGSVTLEAQALENAAR
jgi:hypothetical protein